MFKNIKAHHWFLILILVIAFFARWYGLDLGQFLPEQKASVILSILMGTFSVLGLYLLVKELFDEKIAMISSLLLAVSSWHILVSKSGGKDVLVSFALIFAFYFIWRGLRYGRILNFFLAGIFGGAGFYVGKSYFLAPLVPIFIFLNYWDYVKKDFFLSKYEETKTRLLSGFSLLVMAVIAIALPIGFYLWQDPGFILSADNSIFSATEPLVDLYRNIGWVADRLLLVKFNDIDTNLVSWPVSIFFIVSFIKELIHWLKRKHGHLSVVHTLIFSWLFIMLIPSLISDNIPSALGLSIILPPFLILSAKGIWWVIEKINKWEHQVYPRPHKHWMDLDAGPLLALFALMLSITLLELF